MRSFLTVLKFEIMHYFKNKVFLISTILLVAFVAGGLSIPTIMAQFDKNEGTDPASQGDEIVTYGLYDPNGYIEDTKDLTPLFTLGDLKVYKTLDAMNKEVLSTDLKGGFNLLSDSAFEYVVINNEMNDYAMQAFRSAYVVLYQKKYLAQQGIAYEDIETIIYPQVSSDMNILGKDSTSNYLYTYLLVFGLYFMIIMYGQLIATAVASEKSNRTMEILVTSTKTSYLIFGKVLGGAIAGILQFAAVIGVALVSYQLNGQAWDGKLDMLFDIPGDILFQFAIFGTLGYLLFTFIFGTLGALVSKTEDINASATPVTMLFVAVFMVAVIGMQNTEGIVLKVASFIPVSSFLAMFVRVSMGTVAWYEVAISLTLLLLSTIFTGWLAAKIYRMGTLMYGNSIKFKDIPKILKSQ